MGKLTKNIRYRRFEKLAKFLKDKRIETGLSQGEVAKALGFSSPQFISNWERGVCAPPLNSLPKLTRVLKIKESDLVKILMGVTKMTVEETLYKAR